MKRMIYQVSVGPRSTLYDACIKSVAAYCDRHGFKHVVQTSPKLRIAPDIFDTMRSPESYGKYGGYLPIYEKENAFNYINDFDQIAIIDADIFIREDAPSVFDDLTPGCAFGAVIEREMPLVLAYQNKIISYSKMQYATLHNETDFKPNKLGYEFANMGMIVLDCKLFNDNHLKNRSAREFLEAPEFKRFVDGIGCWKWSTDQTLLNFYIKKNKVPFANMSHVWNGLYTANAKISECYFIHFFLKDKLPDRGESLFNSDSSLSENYVVVEKLINV